MMKNIKHIKAKPYNTAEVAKLCDVHKRTVFAWRKQGLKTIEGKGSILIHGNDLKSFLTSRNQERRTEMAKGEIYCVKCKIGVFPTSLTIQERNQKQIIVKGMCPNCKRKINRFESLKNAKKWLVSPTKVEPLETSNLKKTKRKKPTEQIGLFDSLNTHTNSNLGEME